jgi:hypothetical protein
MPEEPAFVRADRKITDATEWRGDVNVNMGGDTLTFKHRLLNENEFLRLKQALNLSELQSDEPDDNLGQTDAQERLLELQQQEELSEDEEEELRALSQQVAAETDKIEKALGEEGYKLLMAMGKTCIRPSDEDVDYVYNANPSEMKRLMDVDSLPNPLTKSAVREHMTDRLSEMVTDQPYPIKLNVGMQALSETISVLGNGLQTKQ